MATESTPTEIQELLEWEKKRIEHVRQIYNFYRESSSIILPGSFEPFLNMTRHGLDQISAWLILVDDGKFWAAEANLRAAYEHMLIAQWVVWTEGSEIELQAQIVASDEDHRANFNKLFGLEDEPFDWNPERIIVGNGTKINITSRFPIRGKNVLYHAYRNLSLACHPSLQTTNAYEKGVHLESYHFSVELARLTVGCLVSAPLFVSNDPQLDNLHQLCARLDIPMDIAEEDTKPHLRREGVNPLPPYTFSYTFWTSKDQPPRFDEHDETPPISDE